MKIAALRNLILKMYLFMFIITTIASLFYNIPGLLKFIIYISYTKKEVDTIQRAKREPGVLNFTFLGDWKCAGRNNPSM